MTPVGRQFTASDGVKVRFLDGVMALDLFCPSCGKVSRFEWASPQVLSCNPPSGDGAINRKLQI